MTGRHEWPKTKRYIKEKLRTTRNLRERSQKREKAVVEEEESERCFIPRRCFIPSRAARARDPNQRARQPPRL